MHSKADEYFYWNTVEDLANGRKSRRKARWLRKFRRHIDRNYASPALQLDSRRLRPRAKEFYDIDFKRSVKKQMFIRY